MHIKKTFCQRLCKAKICKFKRKLFLNQAKSLQHNKNSLLSKKSKWNSASNRKSCLLLPVFCPDYRVNMVNFGYFPWCFFIAIIASVLKFSFCISGKIINVYVQYIYFTKSSRLLCTLLQAARRMPFCWCTVHTYLPRFFKVPLLR